MRYERKKIQLEEERSIITNMIVSTEFLKRIRPLHKPELFTLHYARAVADWCIEYYEKYEKAPFDDIKSVFEGKKDSVRDEERLELISTFLENLSNTFSEKENQKINVDYEIDKTVKYFKKVSLENLVESIRAASLTNDYVKAEAQIANYKRIEKNISSGVDVLNNVDAAINAIRSDTEDILFQFPGALGKLIRPIKRKDFVVIIAPAKRGKSIILQEIAVLSMMNRLNTLFISLEMPEEQMLIRIYQRLAGELAPTKSEYNVENIVEIPYFDSNYDTNGIINYRKEKKVGLSTKNIVKKLGSMRTLVKSKKFQLECFPAGSLNVSGGVIPLLDNLEHYDGFIPDILILDYADILKPESKREKRHQIDETWQALRGLGQERSIAVITASHSNKATFDRDIRQSDLSEDNRKLNHVTLAIALNQNEDDEEKGIMRMSVIADRYSRFSKSSEAIVLTCFDIGRPIIDSRLGKK